MDSEPPKPDKPRRHWYLHHLPTCVVLLIVGGALVAINTRNYWYEFRPVFSRPLSCSLYGWPEICVSRTANVDVSLNPATSQISVVETSVCYSVNNWPLLLLDVGTALLILASTVILCERVQRAWTGRPQFQISTLLSLTTVVAVLLALRQCDPWRWSNGIYLHYQPLWIRIPLLFGIGCTLYVAGWVMVRTIAKVPTRARLGTVSLTIAAAIWLPMVHWCFRPDVMGEKETGVSPFAQRLAARHLHLWTDSQSRQEELNRMRKSNAEWDFMGRSFLVWALGNACLREPQRKDEYLAVIDRVIDATLATEQERGMYHFLMPYAHNGPFVMRPPRSQFLDGEIALMLAVRRLVEEKEAYREPMQQRIDLIVRRMKQSPVLCTESYPNECWMFCNTVALAAVRIGDHLDGTDHSAFFRRWVKTARANLTDPATGLLISSFTLDGQPLDGPEGSSIWMSAHCLQLIDEEFAADQYKRARRELGREVCGFAYAREWPATWQGPMDVDSGPVVPGLGVSAGSSGLAFVGAAAFDDRAYFRSLRTSLDFAGFPLEDEGRLQYCASNQVGDAVLLYASVLGPVWDEVKKGERR